MPRRCARPISEIKLHPLRSRWVIFWPWAVHNATRCSNSALPKFAGSLIRIVRIFGESMNNCFSLFIWLSTGTLTPVKRLAPACLNDQLVSRNALPDCASRWLAIKVFISGGKLSNDVAGMASASASSITARGRGNASFSKTDRLPGDRRPVFCRGDGVPSWLI